MSRRRIWLGFEQLEISERYARGPWTAVDYAVWFFCYDLGSIADWPVDAVVVQTAHRQKCLLGSLRSAADLRAAEALTGTRASVVVSVCWEAESERSSVRLGRALSGERGHALAGAARAEPRAVPGVRPAVRRDLAHVACPLRHQRLLPRVRGTSMCCSTASAASTAAQARCARG